MTTTPNNELGLGPTTVAASPSPMVKVDVDFTGSYFEMHSSLSEEERRFYLKMYPTVDGVNQRKVHCTVCRMHIGTAPSAEHNIRMHPILRVTHCVKCHDFYNSGEFSKGEDGSELYCRWCGQGGEVYCCSTCPYVFCKSCIIKNLSRGVILDIEQNENWNCFSCTSKILWPLRAQHWALVNYIKAQKRGLQALHLPDSEHRRQLNKDSSHCCRLAKSKASSLSDSMESLESNTSKRSQASSGAVTGKRVSIKPSTSSAAKRPKSSNDEVVCTPDLLTMLEPDCQISVPGKPATTQQRASAPPSNITTTPRIVTVQQNYVAPGPGSNGTTRPSLPPPLVLSSSGMRYRQATPAANPSAGSGNSTVVRRTLIPNTVRNPGPVFHTINGFRVDLNSAAQQDSYRLPNGRLIQVKRQLPANAQPPSSQNVAPTGGPQVIIRQRPASLAPPAGTGRSSNLGNVGIYNPQTNQQQRAPQVVRISNVSSAQSQPQVQATSSNGGGHNPAATNTTITMAPAAPVKAVPTLVRHVYANTALGHARAQLQEQIFSAMDICTHLTGKVVSLTHSNAYNQARSYLDLKELYIHMSYLMTYAIGRFKHLQEKCLLDMREMGFKNDANSLQNGQLAAAVEYVCYGKLDDVDLYNTGSNSFHNQVYEYRKSLHANLKDGDCSEPLPPLLPLGVKAEGDPEDEGELEPTDENHKQKIKKMEELDPEDVDDDDDDDDDDDMDDDDADDDDDDDDNDLDNEDYGELGTEESMNRNEQAHAYDRKLTRLLREYPSIWCTQHPDYGKKGVTRKQWRVIASHFPRGDGIKLRWKNIRKRYIRIERRLKQGKRFKGYFDKATNYLANRDTARIDWLPVDCGEDDGDGFERKQLDAIENTIHQQVLPKYHTTTTTTTTARVPPRPLEVRSIDMRIINFAKSHPVLWRKSTDPEFNSIDEQTRKSLWQNFWKSAPKKQASDDEDNEIEIVEPKTDTITIDSDNEEDTTIPSPSATSVLKSDLKITSVTSTAIKKDESANNDSSFTGVVVPPILDDTEVAAFSSSILASLLEVDMTEGGGNETKTNSPGQKKQPRKKTTNKPNPALLQLERQRMEELKNTDPKLKMKVVVKIRRAEDEFEVARQWMNEHHKKQADSKDEKQSPTETGSSETEKPKDTDDNKKDTPKDEMDATAESNELLKSKDVNETEKAKKVIISNEEHDNETIADKEEVNKDEAKSVTPDSIEKMEVEEAEDELGADKDTSQKNAPVVESMDTQEIEEIEKTLELLDSPEEENITKTAEQPKTCTEITSHEDSNEMDHKIKQSPNEEVEENPQKKVNKSPGKEEGELKERSSERQKENSEKETTKSSMEELKESPDEKVIKSPEKELKECSRKNVNECPLKEVTETPKDDVNESSSMDFEEISSEEVKESPEMDVNEIPGKEIKESPKKHDTETPSENVKESPKIDDTETPSDDVQQGPEKVVETPSDDVKESPEKVVETPSDDVKESAEKVVEENVQKSSEKKETPKKNLEESPEKEEKPSPEKEVKNNPKCDLKESPKQAPEAESVEVNFLKLDERGDHDYSSVATAEPEKIPETEKTAEDREKLTKEATSSSGISNDEPASTDPAGSTTTKLQE